MSNQDTPPSAAADAASAAESRLGQVLALIHRVLPRLDEPGRRPEVQAALQKAAALIESARLALESTSAMPASGASASHKVATEVAPEIAAVIAAAVAMVFKQPYRLVSVQQVATPVPHLNVWALEGRTQIFQSHRIR
jgi:hypothetical protein